MSKKVMLIDQFHEMETRVAIVNGSFLEDFDNEQLQNKLKKGNIYAARVARIEPSLQAAFVDFGDQRHGFLPFGEIHPMYYQKSSEKLNESPIELQAESEWLDYEMGEMDQGLIEVSPELFSEILPSITPNTLPSLDSSVEHDLLPSLEESIKTKVTPPRQDKIKKNQMILVQVVKDARGSKGASLTTYVSLPGKYIVLMPNTPQENGISKKITSTQDREEIKEVISSLELPLDMSVIIRTAGLGRKKGEVKRDSDYLMRLWSDLMKKDAQQVGLIYEEQDLVIRALRDLYQSDSEEILIQGEAAFKKARTFMKMFMPSHVKRVKQYVDPAISLFEKFDIENQIEEIYSHTVILPSGGSLVINPAEALVAIDVNSARSTQERHIEDTALKTNLEAADAIARHIRLRDLSGLIVIDFIDMPQHRCTQVENALKEALKIDRARIQVGKISSFGLLEMSRQRLRQSLLESNTALCVQCQGTGRVLSLSTLSMKYLRQLERKAADGENLTIYGAGDIIFFLLNEKRLILNEMEKKYAVQLKFLIDPLVQPSEFRIEGPTFHPQEFLKTREKYRPLPPSALLKTSVKAAPKVSSKTSVLSKPHLKNAGRPQKPKEVLFDELVSDGITSGPVSDSAGSSAGSLLGGSTDERTKHGAGKSPGRPRRPARKIKEKPEEIAVSPKLEGSAPPSSSLSNIQQSGSQQPPSDQQSIQGNVVILPYRSSRRRRRKPTGTGIVKKTAALTNQ